MVDLTEIYVFEANAGRDSILGTIRRIFSNLETRQVFCDFRTLDHSRGEELEKSLVDKIDKATIGATITQLRHWQRDTEYTRCLFSSVRKANYAEKTAYLLHSSAPDAILPLRASYPYTRQFKRKSK